MRMPDADLLRFHAERNFMDPFGQIGFFLIRDLWRDGHCQPTWATDIRFEPFTEGSRIPHASFQLKREQVQELFEDLWRMGFRPLNIINEASRLEAVQSHLADMRQLAFTKLNVEKP